MIRPEPAYVRFLRSLMVIADPAFWDGLILGIAAACALLIAYLYATGQ